MWNIVPVEEKHFEGIVRIQNAAGREPPYCFNRDTMTVVQFAAFFEKNRSLGALMFVAVAEEEVVGWVATDRTNRTILTPHSAMLMMLILEDWRGRRLGSALFKCIIEKSWEAGLQRLEGEVYGYNEASLKMCRRYGLVEEGVKRNGHIVNGKALDVFMFGILAPDTQGANLAA